MCIFSHAKRCFYQNIREKKDFTGSVFERVKAKRRERIMVRECAKKSNEGSGGMQRNSNTQEERTEIKSDVRGKSSNHLVVLNVSAHIHKTFDSWKLRHLHSPKLCLSISLFIYQSVSLSYWERWESEGGKWFPHNRLLRLTLYPLIYTVAEGRQTNAFSLFTSLHTLKHASGIKVKFLSHRYTPRKSKWACCLPSNPLLNPLPLTHLVEMESYLAKTAAGALASNILHSYSSKNLLFTNILAWDQPSWMKIQPLNRLVVVLQAFFS